MGRSLTGEVLVSLARSVPSQRVLLRLRGPVLEARHHLHHTIPDVVRDRIGSTLQHFEDDIHVPADVLGVLLRQDGDLQDQLLLEEVVTRPQNLEELIHDLLPVLRPAKRVEQVQRLSADGNVGFVHLIQDLVLVPVQVLVRGQVARQPGHGLQAQVPDVRIRRGEEDPKQSRSGLGGLGVGRVLEVDHEVHGLEEDGVLRIGSVLPLRIHLCAPLAGTWLQRSRAPLRGRLRQDALKDQVQPMQQLCIKYGHREELQDAKKLALQPGRGNVVVLVVLGAEALNQVGQALAHGHHHARPRRGRKLPHLQDAQHEATS
mmetsp:Transcript_4476/g.10764  ORF Transcript_4476/g.10764 Transcript_4476/m.10764 type:complete len:317 (+) Transcript_4476:1316-2266(+)